MKFDMKKACKNCPFIDTPDRITFACQERAIEIEEMAYREGFVCHLHADCIENDDDFDGFYPRQDGSSQHCFGAIAMYLKDGGSSVPWEQAIAENDELEKRWWNRASAKTLAIVFENEAAFIAANS